MNIILERNTHYIHTRCKCFEFGSRCNTRNKGEKGDNSFRRAFEVFFNVSVFNVFAKDVIFVNDETGREKQLESSLHESRAPPMTYISSVWRDFAQARLPVSFVRVLSPLLCWWKLFFTALNSLPASSNPGMKYRAVCVFFPRSSHDKYAAASPQHS